MHENIARLAGQQYRLITRSDFDGLVCAMLMTELRLISEIVFAHPRDMQSGYIEVNGNDITTNLPYCPQVAMAFDHHVSEAIRNKNTLQIDNWVIDGEAKSTARVIYDHFGGKETFPEISSEMLNAVDKADNAQFSYDDVINPTGWVLLSFLMDPRTGLGRFRDFRISNYDLMLLLIDFCKHHRIGEILCQPDVAERADLYWAHEFAFKEQLKRIVRIEGKTAVLDLRAEEIIYSGNRFMMYALYPEVETSIHVLWGVKRHNTILAAGKSIFNRNAKIDIGALMLEYGGGGHHAAGSFQVSNKEADGVLADLIHKLNSDG